MFRGYTRRVSALFVACCLTVGAVPGSTLAAKPHIDPAWVDGTESMPPPPTGIEAERLAALHNDPPKDELSGDITTAVVTHTVSARVAIDEEWNSWYGSAAASEANSRMEKADDAMFTQFGINFVRSATYNYTSSPNTARSICNLVAELVTKVPRGTGDVVVGYVNNAMSGSQYGCASGNHTIVKLHGSTTASRVFNVWTTSQHEFSHLFGAPDRYPDPNGLHTDDVMEDHYNNPEFWCTQAGYNDWGKVNSNAGKYD